MAQNFQNVDSGAHPDPSSPSGWGGIRVDDIVRALYNRVWLIAAIFAVIVGPVLGYALVATPIFEARTDLLIEPADISAFDPMRAGVDRDLTSYYQTQYEILESRTLARRTIDELDLWDTDFGAPTIAPDSWLGRQLPRDSASAEVDARPGESRDETRTIDQFLSHLIISYQVDTKLVSVLFESHDPELAALVANTHARLFAQQNVELRTTPFRQAADLIDQRLDEQRRKVEASEEALQRYIETNGGVSAPADGRSLVAQRLADVASELSAATTERTRLAVLYEQLASSSPSALEGTGPVLASDPVRQLRADLGTQQQRLAELLQRYGDLHPRVVEARAAIETTQERLEAEMASAVQDTRRDYLAAQAREARLEARLRDLRAEELEEHRKGIEYRALEQEVATHREVLQTLLTRAQEAAITSELTASHVSVIDAAEVPQDPVRPQRRAVVMLAALFGALVSLGAALFLEFGMDRIRSVDAIRARLGVRPLGTLPLQQDRTPPEQWRAQFFESMRAVRSHLLARVDSATPASLVVTSAVPGEGKTTTAWTLAVVLAEAGWTGQATSSRRRPILLMDADMRAPRLHDIFRVPQGPGLADLIAGRVPLNQVVRQTPFPGVFVLTAGLPTVNPAAALASERFATILGALGRYFDWIVIDAPPVMAVSDPGIIAHHRDVSTLLVVGADTATRAAAGAVERLADANASVVGAVLNRATPGSAPYTYGSYYGHYRHESPAYEHPRSA